MATKERNKLGRLWRNCWESGFGVGLREVHTFITGGLTALLKNCYIKTFLK